MKSLYELERLVELTTNLVRNDNCHETRSLEALAVETLDAAQDIESLKRRYYSAMEDFDNQWRDYYA